MQSFHTRTTPLPSTFFLPPIGTWRRHLLVLGAAAALSACGGGDAPDDTPADTAPAVAATSADPHDREAAAAATPLIQWRGVNLAGAEFTPTALPGQYGHQYIYPAVSSVDYYQAKGMNLIRLPFLWERMQPALNKPLDQTELTRLRTFVNGATAKGMTVLIDVHNYARYRNQVIGSTAVPYAAFGDLWSRLAGVFKSNPRVMFGLMNEPYNMATENWVSAANTAIRRIRSTGATNTIAVAGNAWSGAHSWASNWYGTPNAQAMLQVVDSGNNLLIEVHQYLDADSSGTSPVCTSPTIGAQRLATFTNWLRANGKRGLLGEFAGANNDTCKQALAGMLEHMEANSSVWAGWTYWAGGPWWGDNMFNLEPASGVDRPMMATLQPYLD